MNNYGIEVFVYNEFFKHRMAEKAEWHYIEAGSNDGISDSITIEFERQLGWKGILVEPIASVLEQCKQVRSATHNLFLNCGLGKQYGHLHLEVPKLNTGNSSFAMCDAHREQLTDLGLLNEGVHLLNCVVLSYADICMLNGNKQIDLFVLDVEGFESTVLQQMVADINLGLVKPPTVLVCEFYWCDREEMKSILSQHYDLVKEYPYDYVFHLKAEFCQ